MIRNIKNIESIKKEHLGSMGVFTLEFIVIMPMFLFVWFIILDLSSMYSEKHKFRLDLYYLVRALSFEYNDKDSINNYGSNNGNSESNNNIDRRLAKNLNLDVCKSLENKYRTNYHEINCESKDGIITIKAIKEYKIKFLSLTFLNYIYKSWWNYPNYRYIDMKEKIVMSNEAFLNQDKKDWNGYIRGVCNLETNDDWESWIKELSKMKMDKKSKG